MIVIKTGMEKEEHVARTYAPKGALVLSGVKSVYDLEQVVPVGCQGLISFGLCGGLSPRAKVGEGFIYDAIVAPRDPDGTPIGLACDGNWLLSLTASTRYPTVHIYLSNHAGEVKYGTPASR